MKVLVVYASTDGHSRKIARSVTGQIADSGHAVEMLPAVDSEGVDIGQYDRVALIGSLHGGHYQRHLSDFAADNSDALNELNSIFLSVSLTAAGHDADDWTGLEKVLSAFIDATGWKPTDVLQVAGAYVPSKYDIFRRFVMRRIIAAKDPDANLDQDKEYTDWLALHEFIDTWLASTRLTSAPIKQLVAAP